MRKILLATAMLGIAQGAHAADMPDLPFLRGSLPQGLSTVTRNWDGWYAGGQVEYSSADMDFSHSTKTLTNSLLQNSVFQAPLADWGLLSKNHTQGTGFGGFVGRNYQWDDVVLGFEANYNYISSLASSSTNIASRAIVNPTGSTPPTGAYLYLQHYAGGRRQTADQGCGHVASPRGLGDRRLPAIYVRRVGGGAACRRTRGRGVRQSAG